MLKPYKKAELQFEEVREIGADGRNSRTFLVNDVQLGAQVVMKSIKKIHLTSVSEFFNEAKALYASSHQNVVQIHYACEDADNIYIAMPYYNRGSIKNLMQDGHLTVREIVQLGCQTLCGLHNIHSKNLIHFDVKPDNILLSRRREALLSDFGLAKQMSFGLAQPDLLYPRMIPPEATQDGPFDLRFDIYQFGLTLYRMCNGNSFFDSQFAQFVPDGVFDRELLVNALIAGAFPDRGHFHEHIPLKLRKLILKCLSVSPDERFRSALAVANELALVDDCLDWRLIEGPVNKSWIKKEGGSEKRFTVNPDSSTELVSVRDGGRPRRVKEGCRPKSTKRDIETILRGH